MMMMMMPKSIPGLLLLALLFPAILPVVSAQAGNNNTCFTSKQQLREAIEEFETTRISMENDPLIDPLVELPLSAVSQEWGFPMGEWCVDLITEMSFLFADLPDFNENIGDWNVSQVTDMSFMFYKVRERERAKVWLGLEGRGSPGGGGGEGRWG